MSENVMLFIDAGYLSHIAKSRDEDFNFEKLMTLMAEGKELVTCNYYSCLPYHGPDSSPAETRFYKEKKRFFESLSRIPNFRVRLGRLVPTGSIINRQFKQKMVDCLLVTDMLTAAYEHKAQCLALMTGDNDFVPAVQKVLELGSHMTLWCGETEGRPNTSLSLISLIGKENVRILN
jgi:uncharacterized LabA/DUF88 family protein